MLRIPLIMGMLFVALASATNSIPMISGMRSILFNMSIQLLARGTWSVSYRACENKNKPKL